MFNYHSDVKSRDVNMGNVFIKNCQKPKRKSNVTEYYESNSADSKMKALQLNDSVADRENLPFQIFCYKQFIKSGNNPTARLYQSKLALTEGIIKKYNNFDEDFDDSLMVVDDIIQIVDDEPQRENQMLSDYRKKLVAHLREMDRAKRKKKKDKKRLMNTIKKTARSSVKIIVGKRKHITTNNT